MSENQFDLDIKYFLKYTLERCFKSGKGKSVSIGAFDNVTYDDNDGGYHGFLQCGNVFECNLIIDGMKYRDFQTDYNNGTQLLDLNPQFSDSYANNLSLILKTFQRNPCKYNSAVLLTNRIIDLKHNKHIVSFRGELEASESILKKSNVFRSVAPCSRVIGVLKSVEN